MHTRSWAAWLLLACLAPGRAAAEGVPAAEIDALVAATGVTEASPGVAVLVRGPTGVLFAKGYGRADLARGTPITRTTTFELASVGKQFDGMATLLLVTRGKAAFGDDVRKHLPQLPEYDKRRPITVGDLSRHTSGLPDYLGFEDDEAERPGHVTNADVVPEFARRLEEEPLHFATGERYEYSNSGYMVLGALVERLSGVSFGTFLEAEIFRPLGMKTAWVYESPTVRTHPSAVGYTQEGERWTPSWSAPTPGRRERVLTTGDGGVWASLDDLAAWDAGLRAGKPVKTETLLAALAPARAGDGKVIGYAVGWEVEYGEGGKPTTMSHNGTWGGFETFLGRHLASGVTVVVLSNRKGFEAESLGLEIGALFVEPDEE